MIDRRSFFRGLATISLAGIAPSILSAEINDNRDFALKDLFNTKGVHFGTSVNKNLFRNSLYSYSIIKHCNIIVPENSLKWRGLVSAQANYDFTTADRLYDFSLKNNLVIRGHTLIFEKSMSEWLKSNSKGIGNTLERHINTLCSRYPKIESWDVLNEICDFNGLNGWLRQDQLSKALGSSYVTDALRQVSQFGHVKELVINDWAGPYKNPFFKNKRTAILKMLEFVKKNSRQKITLGIQSHMLFAQENYDAQSWIDFCKECNNMGVDIKITELDLKLSDGKDLKYKDIKVYDSLVNYLWDTIVYGNVKEIITWGLLSPFSYSMNSNKWIDLKYGPSPLVKHDSFDLLGRGLVEIANRLPKKIQ